jgi:BolA protein
MKISILHLESLLSDGFTINFLEIIDESDHHKGHREMKNITDSIADSMTHIYIRIQATELDGLNRVEQHRKIYSILQPAIDSGLHAMRIEVI